MKTLSTIISVTLLSAFASPAAIDGFLYKGGSSFSAYTVPVGKVLVVQQVAFATGVTAANANLTLSAFGVNFPTATNGLYALPKALFLPAGTTVAAVSAVTVFGVIIDIADTPLFVGGGSSLGNVAIVNQTMTGELQLPNTAASKVIFQSSTDLIDWNYDNSVVVQRSTDKTKVRFTVPIAGTTHYYRALVRRTNAA